MKTFEMTAEISPSHEIHLKLPDSVAAGTARVVIYCNDAQSPDKEMLEFHHRLAECQAKGKGNLDDIIPLLLERNGPTLTHAEIRAIVKAERDSWDD